jgi:cytochrome P450
MQALKMRHVSQTLAACTACAAHEGHVERGSCGVGAARCLGARTARLEGELAVAAILSGFPDLVPADEVGRAAESGTNTILRGPKRMNLVS